MRLRIPDRMADITLGQYMDFHNLESTQKDERQLLLGTVEIFCRIDNAALIEYASLNTIFKHLTKMLDEKPTLTRFWREFGFIPNLEKITFGELIDLDNYFQSVETWDKAMAVLFRPITMKAQGMYRIEDYEGAAQRAEVMRQMPFDIALGAVLFFYHIANELVSDLIPSSTMPTVNLTQQKAYLLMHNFRQNGDGIAAFTDSQEVTC